MPSTSRAARPNPAPAGALLGGGSALSLPLEEKERNPLINLQFPPKPVLNLHISEDKTDEKKWVFWILPFRAVGVDRAG